MAIHIEAQDSSESKQIRARDIQVESAQKLNDITDSIEKLCTNRRILLTFPTNERPPSSVLVKTVIELL